MEAGDHRLQPGIPTIYGDRIVKIAKKLVPLWPLVGFLATASAQCTPTWIPGPTPPYVPPGFNEQVLATTTWDPDGVNGPELPQLIAGGIFTTANDAPAGGIARFDGSRWHAMGAGFNGGVQDLVVFNGDLYAGGGFTKSGTTMVNYIARWNPTTVSWKAVGSGFDSQVNVLAVHASKLYAGGLFLNSGATAIARVASFNGTSWQPLGGGVNNGVQALASFQGDLYVGGQFTLAGNLKRPHIARWNTVDGWSHSVAGGTDGIVFDLWPRGDIELIVGGGFTKGGTISSNAVARFNGSAWSSMGGGIPNFGCFQLHEHRSEIYASGSDGTHQVFRWSGLTWNSIGQAQPGAFVPAMTSYDNELVVGGKFTVIGNSLTLNGIGHFYRGRWWPLGPRISGAVRAFSSHGASLAAGGDFDQSLFDNASNNDMARLVELKTDSSLRSFGGTNGTVRALHQYVDPDRPFIRDLVVGGSFTIAGGPPEGSRTVSNIARRSQLGIWSSMGSGFDGMVNAIQTYQGDIYATGKFTNSGTTPVRRMARWSGTQWQAVTNGGLVHATLPTGTCLNVYNKQLIIGGKFTSAGGVTASYIAAWDGSVFRPLAAGLNAVPDAMIVYNGKLIVGGSFTKSGTKTLNYIAQWDGTQWTSMSNGFNGLVYALAIHDGDLYAGGTFSHSASGIPMQSLARWSGAHWDSVDGGVDANGSVYALASFGGRLHVGGEFIKYSIVPSYRWASVGCACRSDFDGNGFVTADDFDAFVLEFYSGNDPADFNNDGFVTGDDFDAFSEAFASGC